MGYYIQTPGHCLGKAAIIAKAYQGQVLDGPPAQYSDIPTGKALIAVVDNGLFEAAAFAYDEKEFKVFTDPEDDRPVTYLLIDRSVAETLTQFAEKTCSKTSAT